MLPIKFPEANCILAENQPEYTPLPVFVEYKDVETAHKKATVTVAWSMTACFELSDEEIEQIVKTRRLYHTQMVFGNNFQPVMLSTQNPSIPTEKTT
jgi:hypothetical protein